MEVQYTTHWKKIGEKFLLIYYSKDEAVPPINQESDQQPPVTEDKVNTKIEEPLNNTELALSNITEQELLNSTDLGPSKDSKEWPSDSQISPREDSSANIGKH